MNYEIFDAFPVSFYVGDMEKHDTHKKSFYEVYPKYDYKDDDRNNTVSENVGNPLIHLEDSLQPLFKDVISHVKCYVHDVLEYKDIFNFTITKTWLSRARKSKDQIKWHIHSTSHISFAYYLNCPPNSHHISFQNPHMKNSLFLGSNAVSEFEDRVMLKEFNQYNSESFFLGPPEGTLVIFPSSITHRTEARTENFNGERLAIVGDVTLTLKEENLHYSMGYIDPKYWKTFI